MYPTPGQITFWKYNGKSIFLLFLNIDQNSSNKNLVKKYWYSLFKSAFGINFRLREVVKRKIHKYAYLRIFSLTTSRSQKLIPKADLKWECPYFYSKNVVQEFWSIWNGWTDQVSKKWIEEICYFHFRDTSSFHFCDTWSVHPFHRHFLYTL